MPTALMIAAERGHAECARILLGSKPQEQCAATWSSNKWRAIELAARVGNV